MGTILKGVIIGVLIGAVLGWGFARTIKAPIKTLTAGDQIQAGSTEKGSKFSTDMRKLWEDHVTWTRLFIVESIEGTGGADSASKRLLKNQEDIGNAIKPYYGDEAGNKLTALLKDHILIASDLVKAAKSGDKTELDSQNKRWLDNASQLANFLSEANPNLNNSSLKSMLEEHLKLTTAEASARINKSYDTEVETYDKIHNQALMMADQLSMGIIKQFPDKFK